MSDWHQDVSDKLMLLVDEAGPAADLRELRLHVDGCPACQAELAALVRMTRALRQALSGHPEVDELVAWVEDPAAVAPAVALHIEQHVQACELCRGHVELLGEEVARPPSPLAEEQIGPALRQVLAPKVVVLRTRRRWLPVAGTVVAACLAIMVSVHPWMVKPASVKLSSAPTVAVPAGAAAPAPPIEASVETKSLDAVKKTTVVAGKKPAEEVRKTASFGQPQAVGESDALKSTPALSNAVSDAKRATPASSNAKERDELKPVGRADYRSAPANKPVQADRREKTALGGVAQAPAADQAVQHLQNEESNTGAEPDKDAAPIAPPATRQKIHTMAMAAPRPAAPAGAAARSEVDGAQAFVEHQFPDYGLTVTSGRDDAGALHFTVVSTQKLTRLQRFNVLNALSTHYGVAVDQIRISP